jgi:hypothetical protein
MVEVILDAIFGAFSAGSGGRRRSSRDELVTALGVFVFPALDFALVYLGAKMTDPANAPGTYSLLAFVVLPLAFTALTVLASRRVGARPGATLFASLACALFCMAASFLAAAIATFPF